MLAQLLAETAALALDGLSTAASWVQLVLHAQCWRIFWEQRQAELAQGPQDRCLGSQMIVIPLFRPLSLPPMELGLTSAQRHEACMQCCSPITVTACMGFALWPQACTQPC